MDYEFKEPRKCHQRGCNEDAIAVVYWPGKVPAPEYCLQHAIMAENILHTMGVNVVRELIE